MDMEGKRKGKKHVVRVTLPVELTQTGAGGHLTVLCSPHQTISSITKEIVEKIHKKRDVSEESKGRMPDLRQYQMINVENETRIEDSLTLSEVGRSADQRQFNFQLRNVTSIEQSAFEVKDREGYLWKLRERTTSWKKRYFICKDQILVYKVKSDDTKIKAKIKLKGGQLVKFPKSNIHGREFLFGVTAPKKKRMYVMDAGSDQDRKKWIDALRAQGAIYKGELKTALKYKQSIKEGYLKKHTAGVYKSHKRYYVCLSQTRLAFLSSRETNVPSVVLYLTEYHEVVYAVDTFTEFAIVNKRTKDSHRFQALSPDDRIAWLSALSSGCNLRLARTSQALTARIRGKSPEAKEHGELFPDVPPRDPPRPGDYDFYSDDDEFTEDEEEEDFWGGLGGTNFIPTNLDEELEDIPEETEYDLLTDEEKKGQQRPYIDPTRSSSMVSSLGGNMSYAEGPGLSPNDATREAIEEDQFLWFIIYAKDQNGNSQRTTECVVQLNGPNGKIKINIRDILDGSFFVSYPFPLPPGDYTLHASLTPPATEVREFPFLFTIPAEANTQEQESEIDESDQVTTTRQGSPSAETTLIKAAYKGDIATVRLILEENRDNVDAATENGWTALIWAANKGYSDICNTLIEYKANINVTDKDGNTALIKATLGDHVAVVQTLVTAKADVDISTKQGTTALMYAKDLENEKVVEILESAPPQKHQYLA